MPPNESAPIQARQAGVDYELVFVDDQPGTDTVLMRVTFDASGDVHEERVDRLEADAKLTSATLANDVVDARLHAIIAEQLG